MNKLKNRLRNRRSIRGIPTVLSRKWKLNIEEIKPKIVNVEHHIAHMASSYLVSQFQNAAILTIDGFGDFISSMQGYGQDNRMKILNRVYCPHSIGLFCTLVTQFH